MGTWDNGKEERVITIMVKVSILNPTSPTGCRTQVLPHKEIWKGLKRTFQGKHDQSGTK